VINNTFELTLKALGLPLVSLAGKGTVNVERDRAPKGVIFHTPGRTFVAAQQAKLKKATPAALEKACAEAFDVREYLPNLLIGYSKVYLLEALDNRPMHAGSLPAKVYAGDWRLQAKPLNGNGYEAHGRNGHVVYDWWDAVYGERGNPVKVFPWGHHPNHCIGVDLLPHPETGAYNEFQRNAVNVISKVIATVCDMPLDKFHFTTHSYASPCERGAVKQRGVIIGRHWDPDVKVWAPDWAAMNAVSLTPVEAQAEVVTSALELIKP